MTFHLKSYESRGMDQVGMAWQTDGLTTSRGWERLIMAIVQQLKTELVGLIV